MLSRDVKAEGGSGGGGKFFVEAEAGSGKRVPLPLPLWLFLSKVKNLKVVQFFIKYTTNSKCFIDYHLQRNIFKGLWFI